MDIHPYISLINRHPRVHIACFYYVDLAKTFILYRVCNGRRISRGTAQYQLEHQAVLSDLLVGVVSNLLS